jgi:hypothetical protein
MGVLTSETASGIERDEARLTNIKVPKEIADLAKVYCIFNNQTLMNFTTNLLERELEEFKKQLDAVKQLKSVS